MTTFEEKLALALRKDREGRGMKNSELTLVRAYQSGRMNADNERKAARLHEGDNRTSMSVGRDTLWKEEGEQGPPGAGGGYTEGAAVDAVGSDGGLNKVVKHSTWAPPSAFPTVLGCGATGANPNTRMTDGGVTVSAASPARSATLAAHYFQAAEGSTYVVNLVASASDGLYMQNNTKALFVPLSAITRDMGVVEVDVCHPTFGAGKMLVIGSAWYAG